MFTFFFLIFFWCCWVYYLCCCFPKYGKLSIYIFKTFSALESCLHFCSSFFVLIPIIISDNFHSFLYFVFILREIYFRIFHQNYWLDFPMSILLFTGLHKMFYVTFVLFKIFVLYIDFSIISVSIATGYMFQFLRYNVFYYPLDTKEALIFSSNPYNKLFMKSVHSLNIKTILPST